MGSQTVGLGSPKEIEDTVRYLDDRVEELTVALNLANRNTHAMIVAVRGVIACFESRVGGCDDVGCINDHHPSCHEYLTNVLKGVTGGK